MISFNFKLPQHVPFPDGLAEQLLRLPPSLNAGEAVIDTSGRPCMQPLIEYAVRSLVTVHVPGGPRNVQVQRSRKFVLIPFTELAPPLEQADFPGEFKSSSGTVLRKHPFAAPIGELSVDMDEPEPLRILSEGGKNCGKAWVKLAFRPSRTTQSRACRARWECSIDTHVRVKTFYSTIPLGEMASNRLLRTNRHLRARSELIALESRKADLSLCAFISEASDEDLQSTEHITYSTKLLLPIDVADNLLPTFCTPLAARRYAFRVSLRIKGLSHRLLVLEVPLQVCYCNGATSQMHDEYREFENASCYTAAPKSIRTTALDEGATAEVSTPLKRQPSDAYKLTNC